MSPTDCGFCTDGLVAASPGQPLDGYEQCPYCDGTGNAGGLRPEGSGEAEPPHA